MKAMADNLKAMKSAYESAFSMAKSQMNSKEFANIPKEKRDYFALKIGDIEQLMKGINLGSTDAESIKKNDEIHKKLLALASEISTMR